MDRIRLNLSTPGFVHRPSPPPRERSAVERYVMPGFDHCEPGLESHVKFNFQARLRHEQALRDPQQPFPGDRLPGEPAEDFEGAGEPTAHSSACKTALSSLAKKEGAGFKVLPIFGERLKARKAAKRAAEREERFRKIRLDFEAARIINASDGHRARAGIRLARGLAVDASLIEDVDYELSQVVGPNSRFRLRLIKWGGGSTRPVYAADGSLVLLLGGRPRNRRWYRDVTEPATVDCDIALLSLRQSAEEKAANIPPTLTAGVGNTFNERATPPPAYGLVLQSLVFFQLFSTLAMKRLVGYGNRLLEYYCTAAFLALQAQKDDFLTYNPDAIYPSDSSVFSAATFEFGGPHRQTTTQGLPNRYHASSWGILTALGKYCHSRGGHIILWDLGLVVSFPPGTTILLPPSIIRYSFVKVREGEHRYALLQWAGAGIFRWFENGRRSDLEFAVRATREEHDTRESRRREAHGAALDSFPVEGELAESGAFVPFMGSVPEGITPH
ncbi:hypothetical protein DFH06DRAFT_1323740 [Mycena polygramma]|nr:hypothetical protein DFH06DRAFT_1323740 [Mycena polygramma]